VRDRAGRCCRGAYAGDGSDAYALSHGYVVSDAYTDRIAHAYSNAEPDAYCDRHSDADRDSAVLAAECEAVSAGSAQVRWLSVVPRAGIAAGSLASCVRSCVMTDQRQRAVGSAPSASALDHGRQRIATRNIWRGLPIACAQRPGWTVETGRRRESAALSVGP